MHAGSVLSLGGVKEKPGCCIREHNEGTATLAIDVKTYISRALLLESPKEKVRGTGRALGEAREWHGRLEDAI